MNDTDLRDIFILLGVDIDDPESIEHFRDNMKLNRTIRDTGYAMFLAVVGAATLGLCTTLWVWVLGKFTP